MIKRTLKILIITAFILISQNSFSQNNIIKLELPYISDGQQYTAKITEDIDKVKFSVLFYKNKTYRIIFPGKNIEFALIDKEKNILFSNKNYDNTNYWDFKFEYTMTCFIEAKYLNNSMGIIDMIIGFKQ